MNDDWLVSHEHAVPFIVTPDSFRLRVGGRPSEHTSEHLQGSIDPMKGGRKRVLVVLFVPSVERDGRTPIDQDR